MSLDFTPAFYALTPNRPITLDEWGEGNCPACDKKLLIRSNHATTLLGFSSNDPKQNPNHQHTDARCAACGFCFTIQQRFDNVWLTRLGGNYAFKGVSNCFEPTTYPCARCASGRVELHEIRADGQPTKLTPNVVSIPERDLSDVRITIASCVDCGSTDLAKHLPLVHVNALKNAYERGLREGVQLTKEHQHTDDFGDHGYIDQLRLDKELARRLAR